MQSYHPTSFHDIVNVLFDRGRIVAMSGKKDMRRVDLGECSTCIKMGAMSDATSHPICRAKGGAEKRLQLHDDKHDAHGSGKSEHLGVLDTLLTELQMFTRNRCDGAPQKLDF